MKGIFSTLLLALVFSVSSCEKRDPYEDIQINVNYPIANVGDVLSFSLSDIPGEFSGVGVRWDMGDGTPAYSATKFTNHTYTAAGEYLVSASIFFDDETVERSRTITVLQP